MTRIRNGLLTLILAAAAPFFIACEEQGPAERAGEQIDEAGEEASGALEQLGREVGEAADESKEAAEAIRDSAGG